MRIDVSEAEEGAGRRGDLLQEYEPLIDFDLRALRQMMARNVEAQLRDEHEFWIEKVEAEQLQAQLRGKVVREKMALEKGSLWPVGLDEGDELAKQMATLRYLRIEENIEEEKILGSHIPDEAIEMLQGFFRGCLLRGLCRRERKEIRRFDSALSRIQHSMRRHLLFYNAKMIRRPNEVEDWGCQRKAKVTAEKDARPVLGIHSASPNPPNNDFEEAEKALTLLKNLQRSAEENANRLDAEARALDVEENALRQARLNAQHGRERRDEREVPDIEEAAAREAKANALARLRRVISAMDHEEALQEETEANLMKARQDVARRAREKALAKLDSAKMAADKAELRRVEAEIRAAAMREAAERRVARDDGEVLASIKRTDDETARLEAESAAVMARMVGGRSKSSAGSRGRISSSVVMDLTEDAKDRRLQGVAEWHQQRVVELERSPGRGRVDPRRNDPRTLI